MTALCPGGGTSSPNVGASAVTLLASGFVAVVLDKYGAGWLKWAIPFLALPELTLNTFCATDPPAIPTFTAAESKALIDLQLGANFDSALSKFGDLVQHLAWYDLCHCNAGTATALPAAPAPPAGTPVYTPPAAQLAQKCGGPDPVPYGAYHGHGFQYSNFATTPGATSALVHMSWSYVGGTHSDADVRVFWKGPGLTAAQMVGNTFRVLEGVQQDVTVAVPIGATELNVEVTEQPAPVSTSNTLLLSADYYCGSIPGSLLTACCPPDPTLAVQVEAILRMVTLIQRQGVPFGYVPGIVHAALSGAGTLSIQGILGAKVTVTTLPASLGRAGTTPVEYFDMGFLTFGTPDGYPAAYRLERSPQLLLPARCSAFTQLAYDLPPGVVITLTELLREP